MRALLTFLSIANLCFAGQGSIQLFHHATAEGPNHETRRQDYEAMRSWHATPQFFAAGHPKEYRFDLNDDGRAEVFLLDSGHSYWGSYSVFTRYRNKWIFLGEVGLGPHMPIRSRNKRSGWHDFSINTDGSRNRLERTYYRWEATAKAYVEHSRKEIRPMISEKP
jgi:hypothetical protein